MSVISIRPAQESLRNLGSTRMPDRMPHFASADRMHANRAIVPNAVGDLAQAIQQGGGRMLSAALQYGLEAKRQDEDRRLAEAGAGYQKRLQDGFLGGADEDYRQLVQEGFMQGDKPLMMRNGDDLEGEGLERTETDTEQLFTKSFEDVCSKNGITGELKERFRLHVAPVNLSWSGRMAAHVATERKKNEITAADKKVEQDETDWAKDMFNAGMTKMLIDDYEHKLAVRGVTREARAVDVRKYALGLAVDIARSSFSGLDTEAAFDEKIRLMKEDPDGLFSDNDELRERLGPNALPEKTVDLLITEAKLKKDQFVRDQARAMNAEVDALIAAGGEAEVKAQLGQGDERSKALADMDVHIKALKQKGEKLTEGSKVRLAAFQAAKRLDASAQAKADQLTWEGIVDHAGDDVKWTPPKGSRMAKNYKRLKESYDRQAAAYAAEGMLAADAALKEERRSNEAALRAAMLDAAAVDPGGFSARLAEAAEKGHVTLDQYRKIRDDFRDVWLKEGMPQKGAALVKILKDEFYAGMDYDLNDRLAVNPKTGRFEYAKDPDTKKPFEGEDVELPGYREKVVESVVDPFLMNEFTPITPQKMTIRKSDTLTSGDQLKLLDWAMRLAQHDGEWISTDPQTGERLDKPRKLNATAEFQDACSRLKTVKRLQSSKDMVQQRADALIRLGADFAQAEDAVTGTAAKRGARELKTREALKAAKRRPFTPKMPGTGNGEMMTGSAEQGTED